MGNEEVGQKDSFKVLRKSGAWQLLSRIRDILSEQGIRAYVVGGWVRDRLLGWNTTDIDFAVSSDAPEVASRVAEALDGRYVLIDKENRVGRVVLPDEKTAQTEVIKELDFTTIKGDIETDLSERDFTIDAMAVNLGQFNDKANEIVIIDPYDGQSDLQNGIVRAVSESIFASDPLRLLRAVRLATGLGFKVEEKTESLILANSHLISNVAGERVREELLRLMSIPNAGEFVKYLDELGLLITIFPEMEIARGVSQPKEHYWDVFEHSLMTVKTADYMFGEGEWEFVKDDLRDTIPWSEKLTEHFDSEVSAGSNRKVLFKLAALLHDVNKPQTKAEDENGRIRFLGHSKEGAATVVGILERLRFSGKEIKLIETEVEHHTRPGQMSQEGLPSKRAIYRYFRDTGETGIDVLFLSLADHLAARGPELEMAGWQEHTRLVEYVIEQYFEQKNIVKPPKLIDGHVIIKSFGINPGPEVGKLLEAVQEAQASGQVNTKEEALSYIKGLIDNSA